jgi:argininosuccinate synthase
MSEIKKVVLAYSGGLDTSIILKWLEDVYGCEVITFTADIGQIWRIQLGIEIGNNTSFLYNPKRRLN